VEHVFDVHIDPNLPRIRSDEGKVHQSCRILVEKRLEVHAAGHARAIVADPAVGGIIVSVTDQGAGSRRSIVSGSSSASTRSTGSATRKVGGTGLGLYICVKMAETLGGRLWLARSDERGSVFSLFLPEDPPGFERLGEPARTRSVDDGEGLTGLRPPGRAGSAGR
jgi:signal transduction histidine kinase